LSQRLAGIAKLARAIDQLEGRLACSLGIALLGSAGNAVERGPDLSHGRHEGFALVGEVLRRLEVSAVSMVFPTCSPSDAIRSLRAGKSSWNAWSSPSSPPQAVVPSMAMAERSRAMRERVTA
jgi:hypothetical protein